MTPSSLMEQLVSGLTPFLGFPHLTTPESVQGVVLGVPFDGGVLHRPGARLGPWALRAASLGLGRWPMPLRLQGPEPASLSTSVRGWVDGGNIPTSPFDIPRALEAIRDTVGAWAALGARTFLLGGDHLGTLGAVEAHARRHGPLGLLQLDAHPDAGDPTLWGVPCHHGTWVRRAIQEGWVDPSRTVQLGIRAPRHDALECSFLTEAGVRIWTPLDLKDPRMASQLAGDIARVGQGPAYLSLDLDVLDPAFCSAVAEPVPGGLSVLEVLSLLSLVRSWPRTCVGADVMELAPPLESGDTSARTAAHLALHLLSNLA